MQTLPVTDILVLILYLAAVVGLGCWLSRRNRTTNDFMAAGGTLPGWAVGLSIFGTYLSSNTFIGVPGKAYDGNWNGFVFSLSLPLAAWQWNGSYRFTGAREKSLPIIIWKNGLDPGRAPMPWGVICSRNWRGWARSFSASRWA